MTGRIASGLAAAVTLAAGMSWVPTPADRARQRAVQAIVTGAVGPTDAVRQFPYSARDTTQAIRGFGAAVPGRRRTSGTGWSVAQDRRKARKRRAVARNRRAHRG